MKLEGRELLLARVFDAANTPLKLLMGGYILDGTPTDVCEVFSRLEQLVKHHAITLPALHGGGKRKDLEKRLRGSLGTLFPFLEEKPAVHGWALNQLGITVLKPAAKFLAYADASSARISEFFGLAKDHGPYITYRALRHIVEGEACQKSDLIRLLEVTPKVIGNRLEWLDRLGLIQYRTLKKDGKIRFSLTPYGRESSPDFAHYEHPILHEKVYRSLLEAKEPLTHDEVMAAIQHSSPTRAVQTLRSFERQGVVIPDKIYWGGERETSIEALPRGMSFFDDYLKVIADFVLYDCNTQEYQTAKNHIDSHPLWPKFLGKLFSGSNNEKPVKYD